VVFIALTVNALLLGIFTVPTEGDSLHIHIPIAKSILSGAIINPDKAGIIDYPASSETILAGFILLHIPLNLFNVFSSIVLFIVLYFLGKKFYFSNSYSVIFSTTICTLYGILRYINTQKVDIWMLVFFAISLMLLQQVKKEIKYFFYLGFSLGMVMGSKYSGPFFVLVLLLIYIKDILQSINLKRLISFVIPFTILGILWYIRNYINTGDPFYPQSFLFFKGNPSSTWYDFQYWQVIFYHPIWMTNALVSEFMTWSLCFLLLPVFYIFQAIKSKTYPNNLKIILLSLLSFVIFLYLPPPTIKIYSSIIFGMRYGFPMILVVILLTFILAKEYKKEFFLSSVAFANMLFLLLPMQYHPKLIFLFIPIFLAIMFVLLRIIKHKN
jgi:hypothetical protein